MAPLVAHFAALSFAQIEAMDGGHVELSLPAPAGSHAGALVAFTCNDADTWIRFAPPRACYAIDDDDELVRIVRALVAETAVFWRPPRA